MDDGYCVRESLEVDNCGQSVAFRDLTCNDQDFYLRFHLISVHN
jgi:hypothetical protein